ncbi:MAG TPA: hemerythrin domain-containing protein [Polyangiaceae bacterium]|nr:hemerythrin domain-containing protein [Polyangiaceae bacterium]
MDAIELLKQQHREVESLFEEIENADDDDEKLELVQDLANSFAAHGTIEERIFYPAAYRDSTKEVLNEAVEEHLSAKRLFADILALKAGDTLDAKLKVVKEQIEHHVKEEEYELFPKVRNLFDPAALETMGAEMEKLYEREMESEPAENLKGETKRAAPIKPKRQRPST